jgi:superkiller protein 3
LKSQIAGFTKTLEQRPDDPWSQEGIATCYVRQGKPDKAITILERRLKSGPSIYPIVSLGIALTIGGDYARAEQQHLRALQLDNQYPLAWFGLGKALAEQRKWEPAENAYRRALELAPDQLEARLNLADLLIQRNQLEEAARICAAGINDSPEIASLYLKLAEISAKQKRQALSLDYFQQARRLAPYTHPPKVLLALHYIKDGDRDRGRALLREAQSEHPEHPMPALCLGQLARRQQQTQAAREYFSIAASRPIPDNWPESHKKRFLVLLHSERFELANQLQDVKLARDALAKWLQCEPDNREVRKMYEEVLAAIMSR